MLGHLILNGKSGTQYRFELYSLNTDFKNEGGIYIFAKKTSNLKLRLIYCGKTENFTNRFKNHHKEKAIQKLGANILCVLFECDEHKRDEIEIDILENHNFPCNDQHN